jgi:hypothetical protein
LVTSGSSLSSRLSASLGAVYLSLVIAGCVRDPLDVDCAALAAGDLVITELRGPQAESSSYRQWIEVYNARDEPVQLAGLRLVFTRNDGDTIALFVRDDLELAAGAYATLGGGDPGEFPYIDYDYTVDLHSASDPTRPSDLIGSAALTLETCGVVVDTVRYTLPELGTLALDGAAAPDAAANDDTKDGWCNDLREGPNTGIGLPGTPREANPPCA